MLNGKFITFEGGEGSGKTTQISLLQQFLKDRGIPTLTTREPGGSVGGEDIRELVVKGKPGRWDAHTEYLLLSASRRDHLVNTIWPALGNGTWVISDRYYHSSIAYQGAGHGLPINFIKTVYREIAGNFDPNLVIFLDIDPHLGLSRTQARTHQENRFEQMNLDFHQRLRQSFQLQAENMEKDGLLIDATQSIELINNQIINDIKIRFDIIN